MIEKGSKSNYIIFTVLLVLFLVLTGLFIVFFILYRIEGNHKGEFVSLEEVIKGDIKLKASSSMISINPTSGQISILDLEGNRVFRVHDRNHLYTEDYQTDIKYKMQDRSKEYTYWYAINDIGIGITNTGKSVVYLKDKADNGTLITSVYLNNIAKIAEEYEYAKAEDKIVRLTTNMEIAKFDPITNVLSISGREFDLPEQVAAHFIDGEFISLVTEAATQVMNDSNVNKALYTIPLDNQHILYVDSEDIMKLKNQMTESYVFIKDAVKEDYNGKVRIK